MELSANDQLTWISDSLNFLLPELTLTVTLVVLILASVFRMLRPEAFWWICMTGLVMQCVLLASTLPESPVSLFGGTLRADDFSAVMRLLFGLAAILTLLMGNVRNVMDYFLMIIAATLGANLLVMSTSLVMVLIALELISISSYILTAGSQPVRERAEAAWKFFIFGSTATAVMIFGMSYLFGLTGTLEFASPDFLRLATSGTSPLVFLGGLLTLSGFLFKMSAVPFHFWVPDVYESIPAPIAAFFSVVPKLAGLGVLIKFSLALHLFGQSQVDWALTVGLAAALSILVGTVGALSQRDAKRMLAWSSIAQAGFLLAGASTFSIEGVHVTMFYAVIFTLMNFCVFIFVEAMQATTGSSSMEMISGMGRKSPVAAVAVTLALVSLTGLPPTAGFMAKLFLFSSLWEKYNSSQQVLFMVVLGTGLICTVISLFFYLRIPYFLFLKAGGESTNPIKISRLQNFLAVVLVTLLMLLFFNPGLLMAWLNKVKFVL